MTRKKTYEPAVDPPLVDPPLEELVLAKMLQSANVRQMKACRFTAYAKDGVVVNYADDANECCALGAYWLDELPMSEPFMSIGPGNDDGVTTGVVDLHGYAIGAAYQVAMRNEP